MVRIITQELLDEIYEGGDRDILFFGYSIGYFIEDSSDGREDEFEIFENTLSLCRLLTSTGDFYAGRMTGVRGSIQFAAYEDGIEGFERDARKFMKMGENWGQIIISRLENSGAAHVGRASVQGLVQQATGGRFADGFINSALDSVAGEITSHLNGLNRGCGARGPARQRKQRAAPAGPRHRQRAAPGRRGRPGRRLCLRLLERHAGRAGAAGGR